MRVALPTYVSTEKVKPSCRQIVVATLHSPRTWPSSSRLPIPSKARPKVGTRDCHPKAWTNATAIIVRHWPGHMRRASRTRTPTPSKRCAGDIPSARKDPSTPDDWASHHDFTPQRATPDNDVGHESLVMRVRFPEIAENERWRHAVPSKKMHDAGTDKSVAQCRR